MSPWMTGLTVPNWRSQPSACSRDSSMPPLLTISIEVRPATVSSAVSKPRMELALVS